MGAQWKNRLNLGDIFQDDDMPLEEKRDVIVARIKASGWYRREIKRDDCCDLFYIVDELADVDSDDYFNVVWNALYDWCDVDKRVWLDVWSKPKVEAGA